MNEYDRTSAATRRRCAEELERILNQHRDLYDDGIRTNALTGNGMRELEALVERWRGEPKTEPKPKITNLSSERSLYARVEDEPTLLGALAVAVCDFKGLPMTAEVLYRLQATAQVVWMKWLSVSGTSDRFDDWVIRVATAGASDRDFPGLEGDAREGFLNLVPGEVVLLAVNLKLGKSVPISELDASVRCA